MPLDRDQKSEIIQQHSRGENDTGSVEVQVALISRRVRDLTEHLKLHKHDHHSRRGLKKLVGQRRRLLRYLQTIDLGRYRDIIENLGLRR
jgi:small subunit ribosomal protein S15